VFVAVHAVTKAPTNARAIRAGDGDRPHDLADFALPAEQEAAPGHPLPNADGIRMELERPRVQQRSLVPGRGDLGGNDVENVDPPGRAVDHLAAAVTPLGGVLLDDRRDPDPMISIAGMVAARPLVDG